MVMMNLRTLLAGALLALSMAAVAGEKWLTSWDEAAKLSKKTGKPILADFTGSDWCGWCIKLKKEVFDTPAFDKWAKDNVILLELDYPNAKPQSDAVKKQNAALAKKYSIEGYPTILFLDASGKILGKSGYLEGGPSVWTKNAEGLLKKKAKK